MPLKTVAARGLVNGGTASEAQRWDGAKRKFSEVPLPPEKRISAMPDNYMIPTSVKEVQRLGWDYIDVILFTGDAFVDHPSFGSACIARYLQKFGYRVAVVPGTTCAISRSWALRACISVSIPAPWIPW